MPITDYYVASDAMGSVTAILDEDGNVLERRSYDAFGEMTCMAPDGSPVTESPTGVDVGFQGQVRDEVTGLYQMGHRWHSPGLGRWISRDLIGLNGGLNVNTFADNTPNSRSDPFGLSTWDEWTKNLNESISKIEKDLIDNCPDATSPCSLKVINGETQCCSRDKCIEQAKAIAAAIGSAVKDVGEFEKKNGSSSPSSGWSGNLCVSYFSKFHGYGDFVDAGCLASHASRGFGLKCVGWQELMIKAFRQAMRKFVIDKQACFSAKAVGRGGYSRWDLYGMIFQHHWVAVYGPHDMTETLNNNILVIDPWESGGEKLYPKTSNQPDGWDR